MTTSDELGNFCHDDIAHPLMWCVEKRRQAEKKNAEESMCLWRRRKAEEIARKERDKQEYYDLSVKHCPWGRPGGGAPNVDIRRKDITAVGLHSTPTISTIHRLTSLPACHYREYFTRHKKCYDPFSAYHHVHHLHHVPHIAHAHVHHKPTGKSKDARGGKGGEPSPSAGRAAVTTTHKGHVDIEVRYQPTAATGTKARPMLEKIVITETDKCPLAQLQVQTKAKDQSAEKKKITASKLEKPPAKDPYGRSGAGSKPAGSTFMKSLGWTNKEALKELDQDNPATPAEKSTFRKSRAPKKLQLQRCCDLCTCTCPAAAAAMAGRPPAPAPAPVKSKSMSRLDAVKPKICTRLSRHCAVVGGRDGAMTTTTDNSASVFGAAAATAAGGKGGGGDDGRGGANNGGVELVPLLARRRNINRPISLSSTDVTKRTPSKDRLKTAADFQYLQELNSQISQKRRSISLHQHLERDLSQRHFETFETFWGRPGHGAPTDIKNKLNLHNLLYGDTTSAFASAPRCAEEVNTE